MGSGFGKRNSRSRTRSDDSRKANSEIYPLDFARGRRRRSRRHRCCRRGADAPSAIVTQLRLGRQLSQPTVPGFDATALDPHEALRSVA
jgi:hypothetical protein